MNKRQFVGKTLEEALNQAERDFDTDRASLGYNIVPEEGGGLLKKLLFRSIRIEAWVENSEDLQEAARRAVREALDGGGSGGGNGGGRNRSGQEGRDGGTQEGAAGPRDRGRNHGTRAGKKGRGDDRDQPARQAAAAHNDSSSAHRPGGTKEPGRRRPDSERRGQFQPKNRNGNGRAPETQTKPGGPKQHEGGHSARRAGQSQAAERESVVTFDTPGVDELLHTYTNAFLRVFDSELGDATFKRLESGDMEVTVTSEVLEDLLQRSDKLSSSYEHIFKRLVQKKLGDLPERLVLDAGQASAKRSENLQELARTLAAKVKETGKSVTLNSRSGQERRVIHLTIDEIEGVATRSIGTGEGRKLVIYSTDRALSRQRGQGGGGRQRSERHDQDSSVESGGGSLPHDAVTAAGTGASGSGQRSNRRRSGNRGRGNGRRAHRSSGMEGNGGSQASDNRSLDAGGGTNREAVAARSDESY